MGLTFAAAATSGGSRYSDAREDFRAGRHVSAFLATVRAEAIFPLRYYTREAVGTVFFIADKLPPDLILEQLNRALKGDPHSPHLLWFKIMQQLRLTDVTGAKETLDHLEMVGRGWKETENAKAVYRAVKTALQKRLDQIIEKVGPT